MRKEKNRPAAPLTLPAESALQDVVAEFSHASANNGKQTHDYACGPMVDHALALAAAGFRVFPLKPNTKVPAIKDWPTLATTDETVIRAWWTQWPDANVGISCDDLLVLDIDDKHGKRGSEALALLQMQGEDIPQTRVHGTASGGRHFIYRSDVPVANSASKLAPGIDVRGARGFIVAPGSVIDDRRYSVLDARTPATAPASLVARCCAPRAKGANVVPLPVDKDRARRRAISFLEEAELAVEGAGGDATAYRVACRVKDLGVDQTMALALMLAHWNDRCEPPWEAEALAVKVANAFMYGADAPGSAAPEVEFAAVPDEAPPTDTPPERPRFVVEPFADIRLARARPALVAGLLDVGALSVVFGESNVGKSFLAVDLALHVALGREWHGRAVDAGAVLYLALEGAEGIRARVAAFRQHYGINGPAPFGLIGGTADLCTTKADAKALVAAADAFSDAQGVPLRLLVVDTLARSFGNGDENSAQAMGAFVHACDYIRSTTGAHVMAVHHSGKDSAKGARGHSSLRAAVDTEIEIARDGGRHKATQRKQRDRELGPVFAFRLHGVSVETAGDGPPVESCVVLPDSPSAAEDFAPALPKANTNGGRMLKALRDLVTRGPVEEGMFPGVQLEDWRRACLEIPSGSADSKARVFRSERTTLLEGRCIEVDEAAGIVRLLV